MNKTLEILESKCREFAEARAVALDNGNSKLANRNYDKLVALIPEIKACGSEGDFTLLRLMKDPVKAIACWAAIYCLPFAEDESLRKLDAIAERGGLTGHEAMMVARLWRSGELELPYVTSFPDL
jgi:hypothetical protein